MTDLIHARLLQTARRIAAEERTPVSMAFEPVGLILEEQPARWDYFCTPLNSITFGSTGGDGVHFGLLSDADLPQPPVVMTVPMAETTNVVLAANLHDFLRLGYFRGFFSLEQLVYQWEECVRDHLREDDEAEERERTLLSALRQEFGLSPMPDLSEYIRRVDGTYRDRLAIPDFETWRNEHGV